MGKIEVFYTGGGIWIGEKALQNNTYAVVDTDFIDCLTIYKDSTEEEKYTPENMIYSADKNELNEEQRKIYDELLKAIRKQAR